MACGQRGEPRRRSIGPERHADVTAPSPLRRVEVRTGLSAGKDVLVREYEIGSEAWARERIDRGLDPSEGDRPDDDRLLRIEVDPWSPWAATYATPAPSPVETSH
jgi:hypothetical protein